MTTKRDIRVVSIFTEEAILASASATSLVIDLNDLKPVGYFSLQITLAGTGTGQFTYSLSNDGVTYATPSTAVDIATAMTAGNDLMSFSPEPAKYMKIICEETGGANPITVSATLAVQ
jgi:hypothetical protein